METSSNVEGRKGRDRETRRETERVAHGKAIGNEKEKDRGREGVPNVALASEAVGWPEWVTG